MLTKMCITAIILPLTIVFMLYTNSTEAIMMPAGMGMNESTSCEEFSRNARFNPYSVTGVWWFVFFYWATPRAPDLFYFWVPTRAQEKYLQKLLDRNVTVPVNWTARHVIMTDQRNSSNLLVERSDRGEYWIYILDKDRTTNKIKPLDVRFKQTGDNKLLAMLDCEADSALLLSRFDQIPRKKDIPEAVARMGYRGRRGRSYLYQGHDWMPIPEHDDKMYWLPPAHRQKLAYQLKDP